jgi:hypothetical protein
LVNRNDGSLIKVKPSDTYVNYNRSRNVFNHYRYGSNKYSKYLLEFHIRVHYKVKDLKSLGFELDDYDVVSYYVVYTSDGNVEIEEHFKRYYPPKKRSKKAEQEIYNIVYKIVEMFINFDPEKDTKDVIHKTLQKNI